MAILASRIALLLTVLAFVDGTQPLGTEHGPTPSIPYPSLFTLPRPAPHVCLPPPLSSSTAALQPAPHGPLLLDSAVAGATAQSELSTGASIGDTTLRVPFRPCAELSATHTGLPLPKAPQPPPHRTVAPGLIDPGASTPHGCTPLN